MNSVIFGRRQDLPGARKATTENKQLRQDDEEFDLSRLFGLDENGQGEDFNAPFADMAKLFGGMMDDMEGFFTKLERLLSLLSGDDEEVPGQEPPPDDKEEPLDAPKSGPQSGANQSGASAGKQFDASPPPPKAPDLPKPKIPGPNQRDDIRVRFDNSDTSYNPPNLKQYKKKVNV